MDESTSALWNAERTMVRVRWGATAFALVQALTFYLPYPPGVLPWVLALVAVIGGVNFVLWAAQRRLPSPSPEVVHRFAMTTLAFDIAAIMGFVALYTFDVNTAMFALVYILPLEGAIRFGRMGALVTMTIATALYVAREAWGAAHYGNDLIWASISFRMGIGFIIALVAGAIVERYASAREETFALTTARRRTALQLKRSEAMLARAQTVARLGSFEWLPERDELIWSDEHYRLFGVDPATGPVTFDRFLGCIHPDDREHVRAALNRAGEGAESYAIDHRVVWPDGTQRIVRGLGDVDTAPDGRPTRVYGTTQDVTELRELDALRDEFIAMASHELRTPTTIIVGFADTLERRLETLSPAQVRDFVGQIARASHRLEHLVEDLLQTTRIEHGSIIMREQTFDLAECVHQVVNDLSSTTGRTITLAIPDVPHPAIGDPERQRQILANLLTNAVRYSPSGEPVEVTVRPIGLPEGAGYEVSVVDHGVGIAAVDMPKVFQKFPRFEHSPAAKPVQSGTGLGLYITRRLVEMQGGTIDFESSLGEGSTFRYTVRAAAGDEAQRQPQP